MRKNKYILVTFMNTDKHLDFAIISSKWRQSTNSLNVFCPPPSVPTHMLAKKHVEPASTWKVYKVSKILEIACKYKYNGFNTYTRKQFDTTYSISSM